MSLRTWEPGKTYFKHEQTPSVVAKAKRRTEKADALKDAYAAVDSRDKSTCRVTGRTLKAGAVDARVRREHHHLVERSRDKGLIAEPSSIVTVCAEVHALISAGFLIVEGTDASKPHGLRFFWASHVKPSQRILEIRSRRKTAKGDE
jgi:hypothetical protein